jgi:hypothetical protein
LGFRNSKKSFVSWIHKMRAYKVVPWAGRIQVSWVLL